VPLDQRSETRALEATISGVRHRCRLRSETGWAEVGYFKMIAPRALVFRLLVKGNRDSGNEIACTAEHSFSSMKRSKTPLLSTMADGRLSSLAILHISKHKDVDIDDVITEFAHLKSARLALFLPFSYPIFCCRLLKTLKIGKINNQLQHFPSHLFIKNFRGNSWKWHFRDPKFQNFLGEYAPRPP